MPAIVADTLHASSPFWSGGLLDAAVATDGTSAVSDTPGVWDALLSAAIASANDGSKALC